MVDAANNTPDTIEQEAVVAIVEAEDTPEQSPRYAGINPHLPYSQQVLHGLKLVRSQLSRLWTKASRLFPRLVWYGQEVDVLITFTSHKLGANESFLGPALTYPSFAPEQDQKDGLVVQPQHTPDGVGRATLALHAAGIGFDTGYGERGRDWFFDYSLTGPVRVKFIGRTKNALVRQE